MVNYRFLYKNITFLTYLTQCCESACVRRCYCSSYFHPIDINLVSLDIKFTTSPLPVLKPLTQCHVEFTFTSGYIWLTIYSCSSIWILYNYYYASLNIISSFKQIIIINTDFKWVQLFIHMIRQCNFTLGLKATINMIFIPKKVN